VLVAKKQKRLENPQHLQCGKADFEFQFHVNSEKMPTQWYTGKKMPPLYFSGQVIYSSTSLLSGMQTLPFGPNETLEQIPPLFKSFRVRENAL